MRLDMTRERWIRQAVVGLIALALVWTVLAVTAHAVSDSGTNAGVAQVITPSGDLLTTGGSATPFSLRLPTGAACTGDSALGNYRVQSFMVPAAVNPSSLQFSSTGPIPAGTGAAFSQALFTTTGNRYVNAQTANATTAGGPGPVVNIPAFDFKVFSPGNIGAGTYNVGIACTLGPASPTQLDKFWLVQLVVTTTPSDVPAGITWMTKTVPTTTTTVARTTTTVARTTTTVARTTTTVARTTTTVARTTTTVARTTTTVARTTTTVARTTTTVARTTTTVARTTTTVARTTTTVARTTTTVARTTTTTKVPPTTTTTTVPRTTTTTKVPPTTTTTRPPPSPPACVALQELQVRLDSIFSRLQASIFGQFFGPWLWDQLRLVIEASTQLELVRLNCLVG